jgi:MFS family permease
MVESSSPQPAARFAAFRHRSFTLYWTARLLTTFGTQVLSVAVGWQIYDITGDPLYLGLVGLVQFAPSLLLVLVTGAAADRFGRRLIMGLATTLAALCAGFMLALNLAGAASAGLILATLTAFGVARAFLGPASASLVVSLVPERDFANAVTWNSSAWQAATIIGPVAGGLLYGLGEPGLLYRSGDGSAAAALEGHGAAIAYGVAGAS